MLVTVGSEGWGLARPAAGVLVPVAIAAVSVAAFVTVFEHDLYDLDLVVTRTVTFGLLVAVITGGYVVVAGVGTALGTAGELSLGLAVLGTAVVAVARSSRCGGG